MIRTLVVLPGVPQALTVPFAAQVRMTVHPETVRLTPGARIKAGAGAGDTIGLPGSLGAYTATASGNILTLTRPDGTEARIAVNGDVTLSTNGGTTTVGVAAGGGGLAVTLGGRRVGDGFDTGAVELTSGDSGGAPPPAPATFVVMAAEQPTVTVPFAGSVRGTAAPETVRVPAGASVTFGAGPGDRVALAAPLSAYGVSAAGNELTFTNGETQVTVAVNAALDIAFADGTATAAVRTTDGVPVPTLGGRAVSGGVNPDRVTLDGARISSLAGGYDPRGSPGIGVRGDVYVDGKGPAASVPANGDSLTVGRDGTGRIAAADGATLTYGTAAGGTTVVLGSLAGGDGAMTLRGDTTRLTVAGQANAVTVGGAGTGLLAIDDGAAVGTLTLEVGASGAGTVRVSGADSEVRLTPANAGDPTRPNAVAGFARLGLTEGGSGTMTVRDGASVRVTPGPSGAISGPGIALGRDPGSTGTLRVAGADSAVTIDQLGADGDLGPFLTVGAGLGSGTLEVRDDAAVRIAGPSARLTVSSASRRASDSPASGGGPEASTATITAGGTLHVAGPQVAGTRPAAVTVGAGRGANGAVVVEGKASRLAVTGATAPSLTVGDQGEGDLTLRGGAHAEARFLTLGNRDNGSGQVTLTGGGTELTLSGVGGGSGAFGGLGATATVGTSGMGRLEIAEGAAMRVTAGGEVGARLLVAGTGPARGTVEVRGTDTTLRVGAGDPGGAPTADAGRPLLTVAQAGRGSFTVREGAEVITGPDGVVAVAPRKGANGTLTLRDPETSLTAGARVAIATGVDPANGTVRPGVDADGRVELKNGANLIAGAGTGDGGKSDGPADVIVGSGGVLAVGADATVAGDVRIAGGELAISGSPARVTVDGDLTHAGTTTFSFLPGGHDTLAVAGDAVLDGDFMLDVAGTADPGTGATVPLVEADGTVTRGDALNLQVTGLQPGLDAELAAGDGRLVARIVDDAAMMG